MLGLGSPAVRSAARTTITVTLVFAVAYRLGQPSITSFATFGSVSLLLFSNFTGSVRDRAVAYLGTTLVGAVLVVLASAVTVATWLSVAATVVVVLLVQTTTVLGGAPAKARLPLLLAWILPVTLPTQPDQVALRVVGWLVGGAAATAAALLLWPDRSTPGLRAAVAARARWLAGRILGDIDAPMPPLTFRPFGTTARDHALHRTAETLQQATWLADDMRTRAGPGDATMVRATVDALGLAADRVEGDTPPRSRQTLEHLVAERDRHLAALVERAAGQPPGAALDEFVRVLPMRICGILGIEAALQAARSMRRPGPQPYLDSVPGLAAEPGTGNLVSRYLRLVVSSLAPGSAWLHASLRAAVGVGAAVLVATVGEVGHGFWVVLGTLSILRSTAFATGRTYLLAVLGTLLGFVLSSLVIVGADAGTWVLWVAFPITAFLSAYAPPKWHFVVGQMAFTAFVVVMFDLIEPSGLDTGLVRVEDVVLGGALSVVVCALLWPFGSRHRVRVETAAVLRASTVYLADGLDCAIERYAPTGTGADRDDSLRAHWRAETAVEDDAEDRPETLAAWRPVLEGAGRLRMVGDMLIRASEFRAEPPAPPLSAGLAPAADGIVADALLVAAEVESGRRLRLASADDLQVDQARGAAETALASWGGDTRDRSAAGDALATLSTYAWLRWAHDQTTGLARSLDASPGLIRTGARPRRWPASARTRSTSGA